MNRSDLNRLIARTMRRIQLTSGAIRECLRYALKWLNRARQNLKRGREDWARWDIGCALGHISKARSYAANVEA